MFEFGTDILCAERQEFCKRLDGICVCYTFNKLVDGTNGVRTDVGAGIVEHHVEDHVVQRV